MNRKSSHRIVRFLAYTAASVALTALVAAAPLGARAEVTSLTLRDPGRSEVTDPDAALAVARQRLASHNAEAAIGGLERYLSVYPQEVVVRRFLGDLYFRVGALAQAEATYREIVQSYPYDTQAHHRLGMLDVLDQRLDEAIREFVAGLPESIDDLVLAHQRKGDLDGFERSMQRLAATRAGDAEVQYEMGEIYADLRLPYDALTYFKRALVIYPGSVDFLNALATAQMQLGQGGAAELTFARCLQDDPGSYPCRNDLGALYIDQKRFDVAQRELERAHALLPEGPEALVNLGYLADERGDRRAGTAYYAQAIEVWPYSSDAYVDLSFDEVQQGLIDQAEAVLAKGLTIAPKDTRMHYLLGVVDEVHGKRAEAVAEFRTAAESLDPIIAGSARANISQLETSANAGARPAPPPP
ncbi:MAG: tetratricopeptide repeat protein [Candidatus Eremiobacteraeota bacterium]|nr:tetratricopeptide repeat protein [Candidatus Eremiobacteraeota bacterium]